MNHSEIFKDLKVVELAGVLAGPATGYFFAELGAQVIKIENPKTGGDITRTWKLKGEDPSSDTSAYYWSVNALKQSLTLDITAPAQLKKLYDLVREADIVISNYKSGDALKLKTDYDTLTALNPRLILASINGFGVDSPRTAYDLILQAESGFMRMNSEPNGEPLKMPVALIDLLAGHQLKEAILIALLNRYKTNKGSHIAVSLFDSAIASLANQATNWLIGGQLPKPTGSLHPNIAPYGEIFDTKDGHLITFAIGSNKQFRALCETVGFASLAGESRYANNHLRVTNRTQLYAVLYDYVREFDLKDLFQRCLERDVPLGRILNLKEVFELPEAQAMIRKFSHDKKDYQTVSGIAFKFLS